MRWIEIIELRAAGTCIKEAEQYLCDWFKKTEIGFKRANDTRSENDRSEGTLCGRIESIRV